MLLQQQIFREVPVAAKPARQEFTMGNVLIPTHRGEMPAYLAAPRSPGRVPGIIILHDAAGMSHDLRCQTQNYLRIRAGRAELSADGAALFANDWLNESCSRRTTSPSNRM